MTNTVIQFPVKEKAEKTTKPMVSMSFTTVRNGKTVVLNIAKLTKEEFLKALVGDSIMVDRQELAQKYINQ